MKTPIREQNRPPTNASSGSGRGKRPGPRLFTAAASRET